MNRRPTDKPMPQQKLMLKKETLKDLRPLETIRGGGFIMKDTIIIPTSRR